MFLCSYKESANNVCPLQKNVPFPCVSTEGNVITSNADVNSAKHSKAKTTSDHGHSCQHRPIGAGWGGGAGRVGNMQYCFFPYFVLFTNLFVTKKGTQIDAIMSGISAIRIQNAMELSFNEWRWKEVIWRLFVSVTHFSWFTLHDAFTVSINHYKCDTSCMMFLQSP